MRRFLAGYGSGDAADFHPYETQTRAQDGGPFGADLVEPPEAASAEPGSRPFGVPISDGTRVVVGGSIQGQWDLAVLSLRSRERASLAYDGGAIAAGGGLWDDLRRAAETGPMPDASG